MIEFAPIAAPKVKSVRQITPVREAQEAPPPAEIIAVPTYDPAPHFVLEPTTLGHSKQARSRRTLIGPPASRRAAPEEVQLILGFHEVV